MSTQCASNTKTGHRCRNYAEPSSCACGLHSSRRVSTPYQKIARAARERRGVMLTPSDVQQLARDDTITTRAELDDVGDTS